MNTRVASEHTLEHVFRRAFEELGDFVEIQNQPHPLGHEAWHALLGHPLLNYQQLQRAVDAIVRERRGEQACRSADEFVIQHWPCAVGQRGGGGEAGVGVMQGRVGAGGGRGPAFSGRRQVSVRSAPAVI